jgi:inosine/xanthosine triphosphate pyrophosphatase family protein
MAARTQIVYVTSSPFKREENSIFAEKCKFSDGKAVRELFDFHIKTLSIKEILEVSLEVMVQEEVVKAYSQLKVPCIVEHAGLVFEQYQKDSYPGGLTKPMWDTLKDRFLDETKSRGRRAIARGVVAYCDGMTVRTFLGETWGTLADKPRGSRAFYWDTVFIPDDVSGKASGKTYAEIVDDPALGLQYKIVSLSQSSRAMLSFLDYLRTAGQPKLWR